MPLSIITNPFLNSTSSVGVGTTTLTNKLNVAGAIQSSSTLVAIAANTVAMSQEAGYSRIAAFGPDASTPGILDLTAISTNGGVQRGVRIDSSGSLTVPNQPSFHAFRNAGSVSSTGIFICNSVTFNDGSHYNSSTGRFTAPVAGRYQVNFFWLMQGGGNFDFIIRVNGSQYSSMDIRHNSALSSGNLTTGFSAVLKLSASDIVDPYVSYYGSGPIYGSGLNGFSMHFLG